MRLADIYHLLRPHPRPRKQYGKQVPARRQDHAVVRRRSLDHGYPGQRHHLYLHYRAGLRRRNALCAVLLRSAHRDGDSLGDGRPDLPPRQRLHRLRIPGTALRFPHAIAGQRHFPSRARARGGSSAGGAGHRSFADPRLAGPPDHGRHGQPGDPLYDHGRYQGDPVGRRAPDGHHHGQPFCGVRRGDPPAAVERLVPRRRFARGRSRKAERR